MIRSLIRMTVCMSCSTSSTVTPRSRTARTLSTVCQVSSKVMPANGSSSSSNRGLAAARLTGAKEEPERRGPTAQVMGDDDIIEHCHFLEDSRLLEGAHHALARDDVRRQVSDLLSCEGHSSTCGEQE